MFLRLFHVCHVIRSSRSALLFVWFEWFVYVKAENEKFIAAGSRCRQNLKKLLYTGRFCRTTSCTKFRACSNSCDLPRDKSSEIGGFSHARFAVAVKSPFDRSSYSATKSLCVNEPEYKKITSLCGRLRQKACRTRSTITFPHSTNQIID